MVSRVALVVGVCTANHTNLLLIWCEFDGRLMGILCWNAGLFAVETFNNVRAPMQEVDTRVASCYFQSLRIGNC
jgi:hypothetical protein